MGCITFIILAFNIIALIAMDIMFWTESTASGLAGVLGIIAFFIGYALSVEITIAPRDFWVNSAFGIFIKKLGVEYGSIYSVGNYISNFRINR